MKWNNQRNLAICIAATIDSVNPFRLHRTFRNPTRLSSSPGTLLSIDRTAQRKVEQFLGWAGSCGVQMEGSFYLEQQTVDGNEDFFAATSTGLPQGSSVLYVPPNMILSSSWIAQEYQGYVDSSLQILAERNLQHLVQPFYLFLKVLIEYEQGDSSPYRPWLDAMPRKWNTAVSMDEFCLSCLPPFIESLCIAERNQLSAFQRAVNTFEYLSPETKANKQLMVFAYNVVFTRSWRSEDGDYRMVTLADMLNHDYPDNVALGYDEYGGCQVYTTRDVPAGAALTLSYGQPNNPSRFLATYGFINQADAFFCKILFSKPSKELRALGYDPNRMLFYTADGSISREVWDVLLYSRLERKPDLAQVKEDFFQAHLAGDEETKHTIHQMYRKDTVGALLRHVNHILSEVAELRVKMNAFDSSKHPRLPLLRKHNDMVTSTFTQVKEYLMEF